MAKIIVHGKEDKIYRGKIQCPKCDCVFLYKNNDVKDYTSDVSFSYYQQIYYDYTKCPECGQTIILGGAQNRNRIKCDDAVLEVYE